MEIYLVIHKDKHSDVDVTAFFNFSDALAQAKALTKDACEHYRCEATSYGIVGLEYNASIEDAMSVHVVKADVR